MTEMQANRRSHARHRVLKEGIVSFNRDCSTMPCQIRDISATGAKLRIDDPSRLPRHFHLHIPMDGVKYAVEVRWLKSPVCGVQFASPPDRTRVHRDQHVEPTIMRSPQAANQDTATHGPQADPPLEAFAHIGDRKRVFGRKGS